MRNKFKMEYQIKKQKLNFYQIKIIISLMNFIKIGMEMMKMTRMMKQKINKMMLTQIFNIQKVKQK